MADIKIAGRIKAGAADGISGYASEILFDDAASNKTVKEKIEEVASSPQTMIVTITPDGNDGYEADKTFAEIAAFIDNGGTVIAKDEEDGDSYYYLDNYIASEVVFRRNIWGSGGFATRYYTIDNTNTVSFIDSVHHISSAVDSSSTANLANSAAVKTVNDALANKQDTISDLSTIRSGAAAGATAVQPAAMISALLEKQDKLTFDDTPTANSNNPVKSGGVYQAIQAIDVSSQISGKADKSEMSVVAGTGANADKTTITLKSGTSATVLTQHQDVSGKEDKSNKVTSFSSPTDTQYPSAKLVNDQLTTKQNTISDLATIRSGAAAGATAYQKPGTGIPSTDLASAVQTSLGKADTAIQSVTVGTTTTGAAGTNASVTNTGTATEPVLSFTIPQGAQGIQGIQGPQGERGPQGNTGVQVDSVASIIHSIDPTATYAAADVAGADAVQDVLSEVTELSGKANGHKTNVNQLTVDYATESGYGISAITGEKVARANWYASDYIEIPGGIEILFLAWQATSYGIAFYAEQSETSFISGVVGSGTEQTAQVPVNANYYRICDYGSRSGYVKYTLQKLGLESRVDSLESTTESLEETTAELDIDINGTTQHITVNGQNIATIVNKGIVASTGQIAERSVWGASAFIPVSPNTTFVWNLHSAVTFGIAFYSSNNEDSYISGIINTGSEQSTIVPANAKFFRCCDMLNYGGGYLNYYKPITGIKDDLGVLNTEVSRLDTRVLSIEEQLESDCCLNGKAIVKSDDYILGLGASFMRGNAAGEGTSNSWLFTMAAKIGSHCYNDALGGTNICYHANRLFNGTILGTGLAPIDNVSAVLIMHTHNKDVYTLPEPFASYSVADYESNVLPFNTTTGDTLEDVEYAKAFDYCIKKIIALYKAKVSDVEYVSSVASYMGAYVPKPCQIVLATHWHDARTIYNESIRKLALKWSFPLVRFDEKIGFTKDHLNPSTGVQASIEYVGNIGGASPLETIDGVVYGWHPMCGSADVYIQRKMASIAKDSFELI